MSREGSSEELSDAQTGDETPDWVNAPVFARIVGQPLPPIPAVDDGELVLGTAYNPLPDWCPPATPKSIAKRRFAYVVDQEAEAMRSPPADTFSHPVPPVVPPATSKSPTQKPKKMAHFAPILPKKNANTPPALAAPKKGRPKSIHNSPLSEASGSGIYPKNGVRVSLCGYPKPGDPTMTCGAFASRPPDLARHRGGHLFVEYLSRELGVLNWRPIFGRTEFFFTDCPRCGQKFPRLSSFRRHRDGNNKCPKLTEEEKAAANVSRRPGQLRKSNDQNHWIRSPVLMPRTVIARIGKAPAPYRGSKPLVLEIVQVEDTYRPFYDISKGRNEGELEIRFLNQEETGGTPWYETHIHTVEEATSNSGDNVGAEPSEESEEEVARAIARKGRKSS